MNKLKVIENFLKYLTSHGVSKSSIKFYKSDIKNFLIWAEDNEISKNLVKQYISLQKLTVPPSTINRRLSTLRSFANFIQSDFMEGVENVGFPEKQVSSNKYQISSIAPYKGLQEWLLNKVAHPKISNLLFKLFFNRPKWYKKYHTYPISSYVHTAILILFISIAGYGIYDQIFRNYTNPQAFPSALTRPNRFLSFQGRLTDDLGNPITTATNHVFKLYDADTGGTELWSSGTCSVTPDQDGIFSVILGSSCGSEITSSVFSENAEVWLGVTVASDSEATPRIQIATVAYALNSETLQGFPAGTGVSTIPYIDSTGKLAIAASSPTIESTSGTFGVVGQALTISTADTTDGNITLNPDGTGTLNLTFEGTSAGGGANGFVNATNANITSGSLYSGTVASNATGYNFINFLSGSSPTSKFSVDSTGLTRIGADLYLTSGLSTFGTAVSDGTIEATRFCTGDGETNCVTDFSSLGGGGNWTVSGNNLYPTTLLNLVGVGTSSPLSRLSVVNNPGAGNYTGKAAFLVNQYENQDILTASASGTTKLSLTNDGTLKLHDASSTITNDSGDIVLNSAADFDFSNDNLKNINTLNAVNAILSGILQVGHTSATTYSRFGSSATSHSGSINSASDILVSGDLELDGVLYLDGGNISNSAGTAFISFSGNNLYLNSSGDVTILEDPTIQLSASNPTISATTTNSTLGLTANGTGTLTLQGSATGNIQFFSSSNTLSSTGNLVLAGDLRLNGNDIADSGGTNRIGLGTTTTLTNTTTTLSGTTTLTASSLATMTTSSSVSWGGATALTFTSDNALISGSDADNGNLSLQGTTSSTRTTSYLLLQPNGGNVGIGTTSPTEILSFGNDSSKKIWIENTASGTGGRNLTLAAGGTVSGSTNIAGGNLILQAGLGTGSGDSSISFQTGTTLGSGTTLQTMETKMTILGNGNVGIGTTNPLAKLAIGGNGDSTHGIYSLTAGTNLSIVGGNTGGGYGIYGLNTSTGYGVLGSNTSSGYGVYAHNSSTGYAIYCQATGANRCGGNQAWFNASDRKLKENIAEISNSLDKVMNLQGVTYNLKNDPLKTPQMGFIAQDVLDHVPEVVAWDEINNQYGMQTGQLTALLVNAVKEINNKVNNLTTQLQNTVFGPIETNIISPIADSELIIDLSASESARLVVKGQNGDEVASIDNLGKLTVNSLQTTEDATISGTLYADNIESQRLDEIENLLRNVETNQLLVDESSNWNTDNFNQSLAIEELFVTGTAVLTNISLAENIYLGLDMVIQGTNNSISSLTSPLLIQPLALASIEIMAGKVKIDTQGNVSFEGNVEIAGDLTINTLLIANTQETATPSASLNDGEINTNATAGKAKLPATLNSIKINNQNIKESSLIYVTPITNTQNKVLFVKSKGEGYFEIGFDEAIDTDTEFNWWIIELKEVINED